MTNSGNSVITAKPIPSCFSAMPGPLDVVTAIAPPNDAPIAAVIAAISSSAWNVRMPKFLCRESSCKMSLAGVIGYEARNSGHLLRSAAAINP